MSGFSVHQEEKKVAAVDVAVIWWFECTTMGVSKYFNDLGCRHHLINHLHERISSKKYDWYSDMTLVLNHIPLEASEN